MYVTDNMYTDNMRIALSKNIENPEPLNRLNTLTAPRLSRQYEPSLRNYVVQCTLYDACLYQNTEMMNAMAIYEGDDYAKLKFCLGHIKDRLSMMTRQKELYLSLCKQCRAKANEITSHPMVQKDTALVDTQMKHFNYHIGAVNSLDKTIAYLEVCKQNLEYYIKELDTPKTSSQASYKIRVDIHQL